MTFEISSIATPGSDNAFGVGGRRQAESLDELAPEYQQLIDGPHTVTLATVAKSGRVQLSPMWFRASADRKHLEINTVVGRVKDRQMRRHPSVSVQILNGANPYHWMNIYGEIVEIIEERDSGRGNLATESIDALAELYIGKTPYPFRAKGEQRVIHLVEPTQIVTFGAP